MIDPDRIARILAAPPELGALQRWLDGKRRASEGAARDYLFLDARPRFEPRREDVAVVVPGVAVTKKGGDAALVVPVPGGAPATVALPSVTPRSAEAFLAAIDGARTLLEARWAAGLAAEETGRILRATFGTIILAPAAVSELDARLSSVEIVRYPTSPYGVERAYWENAADVRDVAAAMRVEDLRATDEADPASFVARLRVLHVVQILGATLDRFYRPASPATDGGIDPGGFHLAASRLLDRGSEAAVFLDGLRVLAPAVGGDRAFAMLAASVGDPAAAEGPRAIVDAGLPWGRVVLARGDGDDAAKLWFIPPRPITAEHWAKLAEALAEATAATDRDAAVAAAGRFHARFVRLHPFRCANQSIAMNLANAVISRVRGSGIPHLALDHLALRLAPPAYERAFARAVASYASEAAAAERLVTTRTRSRAALALCDAIGRMPTEDAAAAAVAERSDAAAWALLRD